MKILLMWLCIVPSVFGGAVIRGSSGGFVGKAPTVQLYNSGQMAEQAQERRNEQLRAAMISAALNRDPWRIVNGETNHVTAHWLRFRGKILQVMPTGVRISGQYYNLDGTHEDQSFDEDADFFVSNFPYSVAENDYIGGSAVYLA